MTYLALNPIGNSYLLVALLSVGLVALMAWGTRSSTLAPRRRRWLIGLRLTVILLVILAMLRPTIVYTQTKKQAATLIVLVDRSRSMLVPDAVGGKTRWEALQAAIQEAAPSLARLGEELEVKIYTFSSDAVPVEFSRGRLDLGPEPDGRQTAIGSVLEDVLRQQAGKRIAGVILASDGAQRAYAPRDIPPQTPVRRMADLGFPLYTLAFGQARGRGQARDVALKDLLVNQTVFVKNRLSVSGTAEIDGFVNQDVKAELLFETSPGKMAAVAATRLRAREDGQRMKIDLDYVPQVPGEFKLTLRAVAPAGELVTTNNELSTFVTVLKGGLNVLYLEGALRVEQQFLRRALDSSPDIKVDYLRIDPQSPATRPTDLAERFAPGKYDVYILGDLDSSAFKPEELTRLAQAVDRGAGLIMLGGFHSFGPGGYQATPLAAVLPITMERTERQNFNEPVRTDLHLGPVRMRPTALGLRHFVMNLGTAPGNRNLWDLFPPLEGANRFAGLKPRANVLAEGEGGQPLLVAHNYGLGRVMAFAADSTWRWWMHGYSDAHKRFWRQVALWLARKDQSTEGNVWIKLAERRFSPTQRVEFTAGAMTPQQEPVAGASYQAEILLPGGKRQPLPLSRVGDQMSGTFTDTQTAGDYTLVVTAGKDGQTLGAARARFLVYEQDLELDNPAADPTLLANLASMTGGQSLVPEQLPRLLKRLEEQPPILEVETQTKRTLWDTWPFFLALVGLLTAEWYFRKKWGLV